MAYVVIESTPGYLPEDDDPLVFDSLEEAQFHAEALALLIAQDRALGDNSTNVYRDHDRLWRVTSDYPLTLDRVVEIVEEQS